ncbi:MAG: VWA domain-containing protein [Terracidiphilus sp.]
MLRTAHPTLTCALALSACLALSSGTPSAAAENPSAPPSAATAAGHAMTLNVEVTDKLGHHIRGLQASDFTLLDNNQPEHLTAFQPIDAVRAAASQVRVVVVLDMLNADWDTVSREREQLMEFLTQDNGHLAHPTSVAMLSADGLKIERLTTKDGNALQTDLNGTNSILRTFGRTAGYYGDVERMEISLGQISQLAAVEAAQPGRKLFFVISPGWPLLDWIGIQEDMPERRWTFQSVEQVADGLREGNITLYTLQPYELGREGHVDPFYYQIYLKPARDAGQAIYPDLSLQVLSEQSGGRVLVTGHGITDELNEVERDANSYYVLSYPQPAASHPDDFHAIQVKLDKADLQVRTTAGYYLQPTPGTAPMPKDKGKSDSKKGNTH